jgi:large conductance mechanosensitive channel
MGPVPANYAGSLTDYAALKKAGVPLLGYGEFITQAVNFIILAFIIFLLVKLATRVMAKPAEEAAADPADVVLLREIRDELKAQRGGK